MSSEEISGAPVAPMLDTSNDGPAIETGSIGTFEHCTNSTEKILAETEWVMDPEDLTTTPASVASPAFSPPPAPTAPSQGAPSVAHKNHRVFNEEQRSMVAAEADRLCFSDRKKEHIAQAMLAKLNAVRDPDGPTISRKQLRTKAIQLRTIHMKKDVSNKIDDTKETGEKKGKKETARKRRCLMDTPSGSTQGTPKKLKVMNEGFGAPPSNEADVEDELDKIRELLETTRQERDAALAKNEELREFIRSRNKMLLKWYQAIELDSFT